MKNRLAIFLASVFVTVQSCSTKAQDLVILHTNDTHSNIESVASGTYKDLGGVQRRADYIKSVRAENKNVLLLDAGDYNQGTPYYTLFGGEMEIKLNNALGLDVACLGNHEFDNGVEHLANRLKNANYPTVCANYDFTGTALESIVKPYVIINKGGRKIGVIGALINLVGYVSESAREGVVYHNPIPIVNELAHMLRNEKGCDLVILLSHLGYDGDNYNKPSDRLVAKHSSDIDIIVGGHSHTFLKEPVVVTNSKGRDVIINQTGAAGVYVGRLDITFID